MWSIRWYHFLWPWVILNYSKPPHFLTFVLQSQPWMTEHLLKGAWLTSCDLSLGRIASLARCGPLLQMEYCGRSVCHDHKPYKSGWINRDVVCDVDSSGSGKPFTRWGCKLASPGEYNWTVHVWRQCSLMSNYFDHLLILRLTSCL